MSQSSPQDQTVLGNLVTIAKEVYNIWITERPATFAAAIAYYAIFSFIPVIYVVFVLADMILNRLSVSEWFYTEITDLLGPEVALYIQEGVEGLVQSTSSGSILLTLVGVITILFTASFIFFQLQYTINTIWKIPPSERGATRNMLRNRILAFLILFGLVIFMILAAFANLLVSLVASQVELNILIALLSFLILAGLGTLAFGLIYKILPNAVVAWRYIWSGAAVAAILIALVVQLVGSFLSTSRFGSATEAAGATAVLLIAFYLLGQIFVLGALLIRVTATMFGDGITPKQS